MGTLKLTLFFVFLPVPCSGDWWLVQIEWWRVFRHVAHAPPRRRTPVWYASFTSRPCISFPQYLCSTQTNHLLFPPPPPSFPAPRRQLWYSHGCCREGGQGAEGGPALCCHSARLHSQLHVSLYCTRSLWFSGKRSCLQCELCCCVQCFRNDNMYPFSCKWFCDQIRLLDNDDSSAAVIVWP